MAFFDKLDNFADGVGDKVNDAIEISRLNSQIDSEKALISNEYIKIGEFYYSKYSAGQPVDPEVAGFCAAVDGHIALVNEAQGQIAAIHAAKEAAAAAAAAAATAAQPAPGCCPNCGTQNDPGTRFCCECGTKLEQEPPRRRFCTQCGTASDPGVKFCYSCGARLE